MQLNVILLLHNTLQNAIYYFCVRAIFSNCIMARKKLTYIWFPTYNILYCTKFQYNDFTKRSKIKPPQFQCRSIYFIMIAFTILWSQIQNTICNSCVYNNVCSCDVGSWGQKVVARAFTWQHLYNRRIVFWELQSHAQAFTM